MGLIDGPIRAEVLLIGGNPICRNLPLRGGEIDITATDHFVKAIFEGIFDPRIPDGKRCATYSSSSVPRYRS